MARYLQTACLVGLAVLVGLGQGRCVEKQHFNWESTKYVIAFGDSYTFIQGTAGHPGFSFIKDYTDLSFTPETLLSNQIVQNINGTAEGGPNWLEYLTGCAVEVGLYLPAECQIQLWDFAFAGADVSLEYTPLHHNFTTPLVNQTQQYLTYADHVLFPGGVSNPLRRDALVTVWIGINDISDTSKLALDFPVLYNNIIAAQFGAAQTLYDAGFSNFLFVNLPPLDRTPGNLQTTTPLPNKTMVGWWDGLLASYTKEFESRNEGSKAMLYDANTFLNGVLDSPAQYGITNTTNFCAAYAQPDVFTDPAKYGCDPIPQYFWFNSGHMTSHVHEVMAPDIAKFLKSQSSA